MYCRWLDDLDPLLLSLDSTRGKVYLILEIKRWQVRDSVRGFPSNPLSTVNMSTTTKESHFNSFFTL